MEHLQNLDPRVWTSLIILVLLYLHRIPVRILTHKYLASMRSRIVWRQTVNVIMLSCAVPALIITWFDEFRSVLTMLSLVAAALTIINKEPILNLIAYFVILWRAVFSIGDRIQIGALTGDVISLGVMYINIAEVGNWVKGDNFTGRTVKVPNSKVFTESVANFSRGLSLIWEELTFDFSSAASVPAIKQLGQDLVKEFSYNLTEQDRHDLARSAEEIMFIKSEPTVYLSPEGGKYKLCLRFLCKFHKRWSIDQALTDRLLERVANNEELKLA